MEPHEKEQLARVLDLSEKNYKILKEIRSAARWGRIMKILYWVVVIFVTISAYYFITPYIEQLKSVYDNAQNQAEDVSSLLDKIPKTNQ